MASFLRRHREEDRVLPAFVVIQPTHASQLPIDLGGQIIAPRFPPLTHGVSMQSGQKAGKRQRSFAAEIVARNRGGRRARMVCSNA